MTDASLSDPPKRNEAMRMALIIAGFFTMAIAPIVGLLPGPGGTIVFAFGLAITLRNSAWAKRIYVRFKKKRPKMGNITDWGLRRQSAMRRRNAAKAKVSADD